MRRNKLYSKKIKNSKKLGNSSAQWIQRHISDKYVIEARKLNYKSRAAFKLLEIEEKFHIIKDAKTIIDIGSAPGGWSQVCCANTKGKVISIDLLPMDTFSNNNVYIQGDFTSTSVQSAIKSHIKEDEGCDVIISDMAPNTTGHKKTDIIRIVDLCETVYDFALRYLNNGGTLVMKSFQGAETGDLRLKLKNTFENNKYYKPDASRKESKELYIVSTKFKL